MNRSIVLVILLIGAALAGAGCDSPPKASTGTGGTPAGTGTGTAGDRLKIAMIPKVKGIDYFNACERGGKEAADQLGDVEFTYEGPIENKSEEQSRLLNTLAVKGFNVIAVACNDENQVVPSMQKARDAGAQVVTFDSDANPRTSGRAFFVNQATVDDVAHDLVDEMVAQVGDSAQVAVVSSTSTAPNQVAWLKSMEAYMQGKYPKLKLATIEYGEELQDRSMEKASTIMRVYPEVRGIWGITSVAAPAVAQAVERAGKAGQIAVVGLSTPKTMRQFVKNGTVKTVILWNAVDLGYLTVYAAHAVARGELKPGATSMDAGRLGKKEIRGDQILLGPPLKFNKDNIDSFDF
jgi:ABC-type sugar transport system substrate-binding protein